MRQVYRRWLSVIFIIFMIRYVKWKLSLEILLSLQYSQSVNKFRKRERGNIFGKKCEVEKYNKRNKNNRLKY